MLLKDKISAINGAGGAVGGAVARAVAREGAHVFLAGRTLVPPFRQDEWVATDSDGIHLQYQMQMYVFLELHNMEYAIQKYMIGFMTPTVAHRSLRTFLSRCMRQQFRLLVEELAGSVAKSENNPRGYDQHT
jgi:hypothetical protein